MNVSQVDKSNSSAGMSGDVNGKSMSNHAPTTRLRTRTASASMSSMPSQQSMMNPYMQKAIVGGGVPAGVFGKKKSWADQLADEDALSHVHQLAAAAVRNAGRHLPYVLPNTAAGNQMKTQSPPEPNAVKFVNSTVENLQNQIKKEEAPKKKRTRTSPEQLRILQKAFATDPMPSSAARLALSKKLGMNARAVQVWFQNRRAKAKRAESMGGNGQYDDDNSMGSGTDEENHEGVHGNEHGHMYHHKQAAGARAASMSAAMHSGMNGFDSAHYYPANVGFFGMDANGFLEGMDTGVATGFDQDMLPGLDFGSMYNGLYGAAPMQGMFSLPQCYPEQQQPPEAGMFLRSGSYYGPTYPSFPDDLTTNLAEMPALDEHGLGAINPLSALLDMNQQMQQNNSQQNGQDNVSPRTASRRSYSLNDIHSQLTTQQIQNLESIGLPALGPGAALPGRSALGSIREEEPMGRPMDCGLNFGAGQDQLLSTIDDLRMDAFWDATNPGASE